MKFNDAYKYADAVYSERFEGIEQTVDWTENDIYMVNNTQKYSLLRGFTDESRKLFVSKLLFKPLNEMDALTKG